MLKEAYYQVRRAEGYVLESLRTLSAKEWPPGGAAYMWGKNQHNRKKRKKILFC